MVKKDKNGGLKINIPENSALHETPMFNRPKLKKDLLRMHRFYTNDMDIKKLNGRGASPLLNFQSNLQNPNQNSIPQSNQNSGQNSK